MPEAKTNALQAALDWAKAHQEMMAISVIGVILLAIGVPFYLNSQGKNEREAQDIFTRGQYYLRAQVDPVKGPFKSANDKNEQALKTFQLIVSDYSGTSTAKIARFYVAKCQYVLQQFSVAYASFDSAGSALRGTPLADQAYFGRILCMEGQSQWPGAITLAESFLKEKPDSFLVPEIQVNLSELYLRNKEKEKALDLLKKVAQADPTGEWGREASRRLAGMKS